MSVELDPSCEHRKLQCSVTYSSDRQEDKAIVSCKRCGFSVEITDKMLTDDTIKYEFNLAVANLRKGRQIFTGSLGGNGHVS
ncbi:hypothetical protein LCGC14_0448980 [marine sediment metagenome]|uniref:Uncharacterized protein n=1 Tax=marine sediment metagenome TaxID=412755 RepID=A0A0F9T1K7_9ZZZZ